MLLTEKPSMAWAIRAQFGNHVLYGWMDGKVGVFLLSVCLKPYIIGTAASHLNFVFPCSFLQLCLIEWLKSILNVASRTQAHLKHITFECCGECNAFCCSFKCLDAEWKMLCLNYCGAQIKMWLKLCMHALCIYRYAGEGNDYMDVSAWFLV